MIHKVNKKISVFIFNVCKIFIHAYTPFSCFIFSINRFPCAEITVKEALLAARDGGTGRKCAGGKKDKASLRKADD